jgi:hypothetical protein
MAANPNTVIALLAANLVLTVAAPAAASNWSDPVAAGSSTQAQAASLPAAPSGVSPACTSSTASKISVSWSAVAHATSYTVYDSTTSATTGYRLVASGVTGTSWTSGALNSGNYWFELTVSIGTNWTSAKSTASGESTVVKNSSCTQP